MTVYAGCGSATVLDGIGTSACFYYPRALKIDPAGNIFVADQSYGLIRKISTAGALTQPHRESAQPFFFSILFELFIFQSLLPHLLGLHRTHILTE